MTLQFKVKEKNKKETQICRYGWHNKSLWVVIPCVTTEPILFVSYIILTGALSPSLSLYIEDNYTSLKGEPPLDDYYNEGGFKEGNNLDLREPWDHEQTIQA